MKKYILIVLVAGLTIAVFSCKRKQVPRADYANEMRTFVMEISAAAKSVDPDFLIVPQNGAALATVSRQQDDVLAEDYLAAIDGQGQEELFYGYKKDDKETPGAVQNSLTYFLNLLETNGKQVLVTDYCSSGEHIAGSYHKNESRGYISFAADERNLNNIPNYNVVAHNQHSGNVETLDQAKNFLYLINPAEKFSTKTEFIGALQKTNYDLLILDRDFDRQGYTSAEVESLKWKKNGGKRLVLCYMSIGEAEDYRSYWKKEWKKNKTSPAWLYRENRKWRGNYKVFYWMREWKGLIYGNSGSYLTSILNAGFDGAYLDIVDAYEYYEDL